MSTFKKCKVVMLPTNQKAGLGSIYKRIKDDEIGSIDEFDKIGNLYINKNPNVQKSNSNFEAQHLYIISDDKIKGGDWFYNIHSKIVGRAAFNFGKDELAKKIIATTDKSLEISNNLDYNQLLPNRKDFRFYLSQPSEQFIQKFVEEYNKGNVITDVLVEYENKFDGKEYVDELDAYGYDKFKSILKINPKDNTITIKKIKDIYSREEVDRMLDEQSSRTTAEMLEKFKDYKSREEVIKLCKKAFEDGEYTRKMTSLGFKNDKYYNYSTEDWIKENL